MRAFLFGMVLLNVAFLLWQMLSDEQPLQIAKTAPGVKSLVLVSEVSRTDDAGEKIPDIIVEPVVAAKSPEAPITPSVKPEAAVIVEKPDVKVAVNVCYDLSGFARKADLDEASKKLEARGYQVKSRVIYPEKSKFLVYLPSLGSLTNAKKVTKDLQQKNIRDFQILALRGKDNGISLGVFRNPIIAENRVKQITALGYAPILQPISGKPLRYLLMLNRKDRQAVTTDEQQFIKKSFKNTQLKQKKCTS